MLLPWADWYYSKKVDKEKKKEYNKSKHERRKTKEEKMTNKRNRQPHPNVDWALKKR